MKQLNEAVEKHKQLILDTERFIWEHPETGYKEFKTSAYMAETFRKLGYDITEADGITGFYTVIDTGRPGPEVLILGELDSIICPAHPEANPETGAVHSCGHNAQCAALVGIAAALREPGVLDKFCGRIRLCAVPAEELLEVEYRSMLKKEGKIKYFGGKSEFLSRGYFDGVDIAFMVHTSSSFAVGKGAVGCMVKRITYKGKAAHAGGSPWNGKNALYAATCGLNAVNAIRETFKESDIIRVHPIITSGGAMVNAIPEKAVLESYVRGATFQSICEANKKVNRALCGAALSLGTNIDIEDFPGYAPLKYDEKFIDVVEEAAALAIPEYPFTRTSYITSGSTDMGDLSCIMPVIHPYSAGARGTSHGDNYEFCDPYAASVGSARFQLGILLLLLSDGGRRAQEIIDGYEPEFKSKEEYLSFMDKLNSSGNRIEYSEDGDVVKVDVH
ncbi:MAG: amidohydrolase [Oscillospiraceae bacterium]|nr:amidohydrolase [Oscillospiraceae bacterium]